MRSFRLSAHLMLLAFLLLGAVGLLPAHAAAKPKPTPPPDPRILITGVDPATQQITIMFKRTGQTEVYGIDELTHITYENRPGTFKDIKVGQQLFDYVERDSHTLDSLTVGAADTAPSKS